MSIIVLREALPIAKKDHRCSACVWIMELICEYDFTFAELREIVKARKNGWRINAGEEYIKQINICDGDFYVYKAIPAIHEICIKNDVFVDC